MDKVRQSAGEFPDAGDKGQALKSIVESAGKIGDSKRAEELLERSRQSADAIIDAEQRDVALELIAGAFASHGYVFEARRTASLISAPHTKAMALSEILRGWQVREHPEVAIEVAIIDRPGYEIKPPPPAPQPKKE